MTSTSNLRLDELALGNFPSWGEKPLGAVGSEVKPQDSPKAQQLFEFNSAIVPDLGTHKKVELTDGIGHMAGTRSLAVKPLMKAKSDLQRICEMAMRVPPREHIVSEAEIAKRRKIAMRSQANSRRNPKGMDGEYQYDRVIVEEIPIANLADIKTTSVNLYPGLFTACPIPSISQFKPGTPMDNVKMAVSGFPPEMDSIKVSNVIKAISGQSPNRMFQSENTWEISLHYDAAIILNALSEKFFCAHGMIYLPNSTQESSFETVTVVLRNFGFDCPMPIRVRVYGEQTSLIELAPLPRQVLIFSGQTDNYAPECIPTKWNLAEATEANIGLAKAIIKFSGSLTDETDQVIKFVQRVFESHVIEKDAEKTQSIIVLHRLCCRMLSDFGHLCEARA